MLSIISKFRSKYLISIQLSAAEEITSVDHRSENNIFQEANNIIPTRRETKRSQKKKKTIFAK
jgi:hypothetical protein